jgi:hypothetical protein
VAEGVNTAADRVYVAGVNTAADTVAKTYLKIQ